MTEYYISSNLNNFPESEILAKNFPIHSACKDGNIDKLLLLLSTGSYTLSEVDDFYGWTPIHWAANFGNLACLQCLINTLKGSRMKDCDMLMTRLSQVPSHLCSLTGHPQAPSSLTQYSFNLNAQDTVGETPIYKAARTGSMDCISLLVSQGAKLNIKNNSGYTPSQGAAMAGYLECSKYLESMEQLECQATDGSPHLNPNNVCSSANQMFNIHSNGRTSPEGQPCLQHHSFISTNTYHSNPYVSCNAFSRNHFYGTSSVNNNQSDDCDMEMDDGTHTGNSCSSFGNGYVNMDMRLSAEVHQNIVSFAGKKRAREESELESLKRARNDDYHLAAPMCTMNGGLFRCAQMTTNHVVPVTSVSMEEHNTSVSLQQGYDNIMLDSVIRQCHGC